MSLKTNSRVVNYFLLITAETSANAASSSTTSSSSSTSSSPDIVLCGCCRASYPLGEIVRFIEHKVNHCRNGLPGCQSPSPTAAPEDSDPEDALALKGSSTNVVDVVGQEKLNSVPSISAPIIKRSGRVESPPTSQGTSDSVAVSPIELRASASSTPKRRTNESTVDELLDKDDQPKKPKTESVDADTNTVNSGKSFFFFF